MKVDKKRLLVMSHSAILKVNRALFEALARVAQVEITLVAPKTWKGDLIRDLEFQENEGRINPTENFKTIPLPVSLSGNGSLFFYRSPIRKLIQASKPDFLFLDEEPWSLAAFQASLSTPSAMQCFYTKQNLKKTIPFPFPWIQKSVFRQSQFAFAVSTEVEEVLRWKNYQKPIHVLPHSYDPDLFRPLTEIEKLSMKVKLGISPDAFVISYFGRLSEDKGIQDWLHAMESLHRKNLKEKIYFLWVGNGPLSQEVQTACDRIHPHRAILLPAQPHHEVGRVLAASDLLVLPSRTCPHWKEQFGRILIEAMGCGVAVAGSNSGEIPHLIQKTGAGIVFPERQPQALEEGIQKLLEQPEAIRDFKAKGRMAAEAQYTHEKVALKLAGFLGLTLK